MISTEIITAREVLKNKDLVQCPRCTKFKTALTKPWRIPRRCPNCLHKDNRQ